MPDIDLEPSEYRGRRVFRISDNAWKVARNMLPIPLVGLLMAWVGFSWPSFTQFAVVVVPSMILGGLLVVWLDHYPIDR